MNIELIIPIAGGVYVAEALSVILQVLYFKATGGKRLFRMSPLHHHFELLGWKETRVVSMFWAVTILLCGISILAL
jgi:phospho-N-acetylmuramoyl-pentapeptide-transferase